uniref:Choice-of-anchor B domain-containing protein n=1 Tax=Hirondellea gigas TaxID=1518452 RepID=A0A6A7G9D3_9CRUS
MPLVVAEIIKSRKRCNAEQSCFSNEVSIKGNSEPLKCINGFSGKYPCLNADLMSLISLSELSGKPQSEVSLGSDIWGWDDPETHSQYAISCLEDGTSFVDVSNPLNPTVVAFLPSNVPDRIIWRDIKVYKNIAFIIADDTSSSNSHGMQIFDLTSLRSIPNANRPKVVNASLVYTEFGGCHNLHITEETGYLYCVGSTTCLGGLHIVNVQNPLKPLFVGCFSDDGYTHDLQCVIYHGFDKEYFGSEICFAFNENTLTIIDVSQKSDIKLLSRTSYDRSEYTHQGWLTENHMFLLMGDELDEILGTNDGRAKTFIWSLERLKEPKLIGNFQFSTTSIDHNLYIVDDLSFHANFEAGLRILDICDIGTTKLSEIAYFDVHPESDSIDFRGAWSSYPFFMKSTGIVLVQSIESGLFIIRPNITTDPKRKCSRLSTTAPAKREIPEANTPKKTEDKTGKILLGLIVGLTIVGGIVGMTFWIRNRKLSRMIASQRQHAKLLEDEFR